MFLAIAVDNISLDDAEETVEAEEEAAREEHMAEVKEKYAPSGSANGDIALEVGRSFINTYVSVKQW